MRFRGGASPLSVVALALALGGCTTDSTALPLDDGGGDTGTPGTDAALADATTADGGLDAAPPANDANAETDVGASSDAGPDASPGADAGVDAGADAGTDAAPEGGSDASTHDAGHDSGIHDSGFDAKG